ncbi:small ribosomal subunit protein bS18m [Tribolium castaneum]|uniref:28S ribosomal protein S18c, mitochondrial-like Protein n=1 Tax=Tribolium castaneum TaxID=7070 RepID=D6X0H2_TRICA|nr:PREDICTED: 28S ribosomal protein S18c, mitochondrial [Tribolium castaneum]EFA10545.1 28S ribosomal protein S18c, mitochondrial-like Protein [Tribolium castaneum]|eukprot:XP_971303.1 PREDICTED: 28S ribosomal protein S18c, mitochondrial [Tribolium castaneum]
MFRQFLSQNSVFSRSVVRYVPQIRTQSTTDEPLFDMENPFEKERQQCLLCRHKIIPNYKNVKLLSQFQSPYTGRVYGKHITGLCDTQQKLVEAEIIKAQNAGLMATYLKEPCYLKDPKLFDADNPIRPHRF